VAGFSFEVGSEVAYNRLENATEFTAGRGRSGPHRLPIDRAVVDELRTESYSAWAAAQQVLAKRGWRLRRRA
jgi:hypothetical protein